MHKEWLRRTLPPIGSSSLNAPKSEDSSLQCVIHFPAQWIDAWGVDEPGDHHVPRTTDRIKSGIATRQVVVCPDRLDPSVRLQHGAVLDNGQLLVVARLAQDIPPANQRRIRPA